MPVAVIANNGTMNDPFEENEEGGVKCAPVLGCPTKDISLLNKTRVFK